MDFMSHGKQLWTPFPDHLPYDEIVFPKEETENDVKEGAPTEWSYKFFDGADRTVASLMESVDPRDAELRERVKTYFEICHDVYVAFVPPSRLKFIPYCFAHFFVAWLKVPSNQIEPFAPKQPRLPELLFP